MSQSPTSRRAAASPGASSSAPPPGQLRVKRAYDPPETTDGVRVLVDRLWPRGLSKSRAAVDRWMKELAPSSELRRWFAHQPERWPEFLQRYAAELAQRPEPLEELRALAQRGTVTLLFGARDEAHNNAVALRDFLLGDHDQPV